MTGAGSRNRREQAAWRREQILDAAVTVFGRAGVQSASMKQVAATANVVPGLLYHYFDNKETLVLTVIKERGFLPELRRLLEVEPERPATQVLPEIAAGFARLVRERGELVTLFLSGVAADENVRQGLRSYIAEGCDLVAKYLSRRVDAGELREHDASSVAQLLLAGVVLGTVADTAQDPSSMVDALLHGLLAE